MAPVGLGRIPGLAGVLFLSILDVISVGFEPTTFST